MHHSWGSVKHFYEQSGYTKVTECIYAVSIFWLNHQADRKHMRHWIGRPLLLGCRYLSTYSSMPPRPLPQWIAWQCRPFGNRAVCWKSWVYYDSSISSCFSCQVSLRVGWRSVIQLRLIIRATGVTCACGAPKALDTGWGAANCLQSIWVYLLRIYERWYSGFPEDMSMAQLEIG